ncbi:MAG: hypothetical protein GY904_02085 [Planctomycetaceae bacterium]|nr:hypothetical protein [Planctomycetaceae bacterium]
MLFQEWAVSRMDGVLPSSPGIPQLGAVGVPNAQTALRALNANAALEMQRRFNVPELSGRQDESCQG